MFAWAGAELGLGLQASAYPMPPRLIIVYATLLQGLPTRIFFASLIHEWACDARGRMGACDAGVGSPAFTRGWNSEADFTDRGKVMASRWLC